MKGKSGGSLSLLSSRKDNDCWLICCELVVDEVWEQAILRFFGVGESPLLELRLDIAAYLLSVIEKNIVMLIMKMYVL